MAAPHVTGVVARYLGANPRANPRKVLRSVVAGTAPSVVGAGAGSPRGVLNTLFLEGPAPDRLRVPRLTRLRLGATLGPVTFRAGAPATVRAVAGSLPPGLELDPTGRFDGSVSGYGSGAVTIRVEDVFGRGSELTVPWISVGTPDLGALETVSVVSGRRSLSVSWEGVQRPVVTRGSDVQRLEVRAIPERGPTRTCKVRVRRGSLPGDCGIPRLVGSQEYTLEVRAMNAAGWSDWIDVTAIDTGITASDRTPGS